MNKELEKILMSKKLRQCAENDVYIKHMLGEDYAKEHSEEFEYYSDTAKVMKELTDKYHFTPEEVFRFQRSYDINVMTLQLKKGYIE